MTVLLLAALFLRPHADTDSTAVLRQSAGTLQLVLTLDADHLLQSAGAREPDGTDWTPGRIEELREATLEHLRRHYSLRTDRGPLELGPGRLEARRDLDLLYDRERVVTLAATFTIPRPAGDLRLSVQQDLLAGRETAHRHVLHLEGPGGKTYLVPRGRPLDLVLPDPAQDAGRRRLLRQLVRGVRAGASPALLLLLAALLLAVARRARAILWFSAGLALALLLCSAGLLQADLRVAGLGAALSVLFVAGENLLAREIRWREATAFLFGLVHGLALAPQLASAVLPETRRLGGSIAFGVGALLVPGLGALLARTPIPAIRTRRIGSAAVLAGGLAVLLTQLAR